MVTWYLLTLLDWIEMIQLMYITLEQTNGFSYFKNINPEVIIRRYGKDTAYLKCPFLNSVLGSYKYMFLKEFEKSIWRTKGNLSAIHLDDTAVFIFRSVWSTGDAKQLQEAFEHIQPKNMHLKFNRCLWARLSYL